jgi:ribosomal protein S18 acetylase RimI-like enzyme
MSRDLDVVAPRAPAPTGPAVEVRMLGPRDLPLLAGAPADLVGEAADPRLAKAILDDPRRFVAAAIAGGRLVGIASAVLANGTRSLDGLVLREVAVAVEHRRRGLGRRLLATLFAHARASGCREARVDAPHDDVALRRLCAAAGGIELPEPVVRVAFPLG